MTKIGKAEAFTLGTDWETFRKDQPLHGGHLAWEVRVPDAVEKFCS